MPHSSNDQPAARFARYHTDSDERVLRVRYPKKRFGGISSRAIGMPNIIATTGNTNVANASFTSMARLYALGWPHVSGFSRRRGQNTARRCTRSFVANEKRLSVSPPSTIKFETYSP